MNLVQRCINFPVTTTVGVILLVMFGVISIFKLPIQLTPDVEKPVITVNTYWPGASPLEIEREIIEAQEEQLKSIEGLLKMESESHDGFGSITLRFEIGTDKDVALLKVSNRLDQVESYPQLVEKPIVTGETGVGGAIAWISMTPFKENGFAGDISTLFDFVDDNIKPEFERVKGVSQSNIYGGREHEVQVIVDPAKLALRNVTMTELADAIERENRNYSGGDFDEGKRRYIVRTVGEYKTPEDIENIVIAVRNGVPIYLRDVATARLDYEKATGANFGMHQQKIVMNVQRQAGENVIDIMDEINRKIELINRDLLAPRGLEMTLSWAETGYIKSAINLVRNNLLIGALLAICILLLFLRNVSTTLIIAIAIPISIIGTFLMMSIFGRTINVISLAGIAFATGMVVDNSIVVLENIYRHRQLGKSITTSALEGAREVWGAVLASTLTTIAVFAPVVLIKEEVGQLFADIAVAISCAVGLSLIVAVTVIPSMSARILHIPGEDKSKPVTQPGPWNIVVIATRINHLITRTVTYINQSVTRKLTLVATCIIGAVVFSMALMPKAEYLPSGNTDFVFGLILPPPGYSLKEKTDMNKIFSKDLAYLKEAPAGSGEAEKLPGGGIATYFMGTWSNIVFMGMGSNDPQRATELIPEIQRSAGKIPGSIALVQTWGLFEDEGGAGRSIDIEVKGPELEKIIELGGVIFQQIFAALPGAQAFPIPGLDLGNPEVQVEIDRQRAAQLGISNRELGFTVSALVDGIKVSDYIYKGREIDLKLMTDKDYTHRTHLLEELPVATPDGKLVTLGALADISIKSGPVQINRRERSRTITIRVSPEAEMPIEVAMDTIKEKILMPMEESGQLGGLYNVELTGSADKLVQAGKALQTNLLLAITITFLLMSALFESFLYPFVIMFSVPLAALGGFLGLLTVNQLIGYQPMDVLTMLGFIILIGTVVNNPILIVHQSLNHMRNHGMGINEAISEAVSNRIRPIFMSAGTSSLAMLPLIIAPGAGSELYRGIGSVVVGGLLVSTLFTLFLVPAMLSLTLSARVVLAEKWRNFSWNPHSHQHSTDG